MACKSCKKTNEEIVDDVVIAATTKTHNKIIRNYIYNFLIFLILATLITPFIIPIVLIVMFRIIVLSKSINLLPVVKYIGQKIFKDTDEDEEDNEFENDEDLDEEDDEEYEPINSDEIIVVNNVK